MRRRGPGAKVMTRSPARYRRPPGASSSGPDSFPAFSQASRAALVESFDAVTVVGDEESLASLGHVVGPCLHHLGHGHVFARGCVHTTMLRVPVDGASGSDPRGGGRGHGARPGHAVAGCP